MDLGLEIARKGREMTEQATEIVRNLSAEDLGLIGSTPSPKSHVKRISERHRALARLLVTGISNVEAALMTGYSEGTVALLKSDPTFKQLLAVYAEKRDFVFEQVFDKLSNIAGEALDIIRERMEAEPEKLSFNQLMDVTKLTTDRIGHGPTATKNVNVNVGVADRLEAARRRVMQSRQIEATAVEVRGEDAA